MNALAAAGVAGVDVLVSVGRRAAAMLDAAALAGELVGPGDVVLVKAFRGVGLEVVAEALVAADEAASAAPLGDSEAARG